MTIGEWLAVAGAFVTLLGFIWRASWQLSRMNTRVDLMLSRMDRMDKRLEQLEHDIRVGDICGGERKT